MPQTVPASRANFLSATLPGEGWSASAGIILSLEFIVRLNAPISLSMDHIFKIGDNAFVSVRRFAPPLSAACLAEILFRKNAELLCFRWDGPDPKGLGHCAI